MPDYTKIYIYTTGKNKNKIVFRDITIPMQIQDPLPAFQVGDVTQDNVETLFEITKFGTVTNILDSETFQECLVKDWVRAFNEFGVEIDNYTSRLSPDETYADDEVPAWSTTLHKFIPAASSPGGGVTRANTITNTATNYSVIITDQIVRITDTSAARTITMPDATTCAGYVFDIKDATGNASVNNITITGVLSQLFDGAATLVIAGDWNSYTIYSNGTAWEIK